MRQSVCNFRLIPVAIFAGILWLGLIRPVSIHAWCTSVCDDIRQRGYVNVMTLNLLYGELVNRNARLEAIADFMADAYEKGDPVDIVLLQEVVGGPLSGTTDSSRDLNRLLSRKGLSYCRTSHFYMGKQGPIKVGNAILSRCRMWMNLSFPLPAQTEHPFPGIQLTMNRNLVFSRVFIPGFGGINVFNTHLCAYCDVDGRAHQIRQLLNLSDQINQVGLWPDTPSILAGDFNLDLSREDQHDLYQLILGRGYTDSQQVANDCDPCCDNDTNAQGCTFGAPGNPYGQGSARIDYIFVRGLRVLGSRVVFNSDDSWVSDHSAVLTIVGLE